MYVEHETQPSGWTQAEGEGEMGTHGDALGLGRGDGAGVGEGLGEGLGTGPGSGDGEGLGVGTGPGSVVGTGPGSTVGLGLGGTGDGNVGMHDPSRTHGGMRMSPPHATRRRAVAAMSAPALFAVPPGERTARTTASSVGRFRATHPGDAFNHFGSFISAPPA